MLPGRMWQLIINGPGYFDTPYDLPEGLTSLGRAEENDIVLSGDLVSRKHVRLRVVDGALQVEDLGSRNGSKLNGEPFTGTKPLRPGDLLAIGENSLSIRQPSEAESAATEVLDLKGSQVRKLDEDAGFAPEVIVKRNVNHSVLLRALDNFGPVVPDHQHPTGPAPLPDPVGLPFSDAPPVAAGIAAPPLSYDSLVLLFKTAEALARSHSLKDFLHDTVDRLLARTGATTMVVLLRPPPLAGQPPGPLSPAAVRHRGELDIGEVPVSDAIITEAIRSGSALAVAVRDDARFSGRESVLLYQAEQVLCVPVGEHAPFAGVLYLNRTSDDERESLESLLDLLTAVGHLIAAAVVRFRSEDLPGERLQRALEQFFSPAIADRRRSELGTAKDALSRLDDRPCTVVSAEISGLDVLARSGPEKVVELLTEFQARLPSLVFSFEGAVERCAGGQLRAIFGAPYAHPDDPVRAVRAAASMKAEWEELLATVPGASACGLQIGVHTGRLLCGLVGSDSRLELSAIGEAAAVATRLSALAPVGEIWLTGKTLARIGARFDVTPQGEQPLGPRVEKTAVFQLLGEDLDDHTSTGGG